MFLIILAAPDLLICFIGVGRLRRAVGNTEIIWKGTRANKFAQTQPVGPHQAPGLVFVLIVWWLRTAPLSKLTMFVFVSKLSNIPWGTRPDV